MEVLLEGITITCEWNYVLHEQFLKPDTLVLIPAGGYSDNVRCSKKALMWIVYKDKTDGCKILHGHKRRHYRLPELPHLSVEYFCAKTRTVYEFCGRYWHGDTCLPFRDVNIVVGYTISEGY